MHFGRKFSSIFTFDPAAPTSTGFSFARFRFASRLRIHATSRFCLVRSSIVQTFDRLVRALRSRSLVACACVRLLGPCFKTGRLGRSHQSRRLARCSTQRRCHPGSAPASKARAAARPAKERRLRASSDLDPSQAGRGLLRRRSSTAGRRRASAPRRRPRVGRPRPTPARPCGFSPFGRFRGLFDSLFRVLFDFPSRYLCAIGLAIGVEPRMERTTRLRAAFSNDPTLEPTRRFDLEARAR